MFTYSCVSIPSQIRECLLNLNIQEDKQFWYTLPSSFPYSKIIQDIICQSPTIPTKIKNQVKMANDFSLTRIRKDEFVNFHTKIDPSLNKIVSIIITPDSKRDFVYASIDDGSIKFVKLQIGTILAYDTDLMKGFMPSENDSELVLFNMEISS